jgi:hypothetical protein
LGEPEDIGGCGLVVDIKAEGIDEEVPKRLTRYVTRMQVEDIPQKPALLLLCPYNHAL